MRNHTSPSNGQFQLAALPGQRTLRSLLGLSDDQLKVIDPLEMNLLVAREVPGLSGLNIAAYRQTADKWAHEIKASCSGPGQVSLIVRRRKHGNVDAQ